MMFLAKRKAIRSTLNKTVLSLSILAIVMPNLIIPTPVSAASKKFVFPNLGSESIQSEAYTEAPLIEKIGVDLFTEEPSKTQEFEPKKYAVAFRVKSEEDLTKIRFKVTKGDETTTALLIPEESDTDIHEDREYKYFSNLFTFESGIKKLEIFAEGVDYQVDTFDFDTKTNSSKFIKPAAADYTSTFFATQQAEKEYRKGVYRDLGITMITRDEWGAPHYNDEWDPPEILSCNRIMVHHTATSGGNDPKAEIRGIYQYHAVTQGWTDIGYNYLIDKYGNIYEGRAGGNCVRGAHAGTDTESGMNANYGSIGVAMLGTYSTQKPTNAAIQSLTKLMAAVSTINNFELDWHANKTSFNTATDYGVYAHRDAHATACPGGALYDILPSITSTAKSYKNSSISLTNLESKIENLVEEAQYVRDNTTSEVIVDTSVLTPALQEKFFTKSRGVQSYYEYADKTIFRVKNGTEDALIAETLLLNPNSNAQTNLIYELSSWDNSSPTQSIPSDYDTTTHWNQEITNVPEAWKNMGGCSGSDTCGGSSSVVVAVIDTGVAYENYNFDAGTDTSYTREKFSGLFVEYPTTTTLDGVYANSTNYQGYERQYTAASEVNGITFVSPRDVAQDYLCYIRQLSGVSAKYCNSAENAKINHANDDNGHGTAVTTILAGDTGDNAPNELVGIAHNVQIMPIKVFLPNDTSMCQTSGGAYDASCSNPTYDFRSVSSTTLIVEAVDYAVANGADIINMSLGGSSADATLEDSLEAARDAGVIVIAASGNYSGGQSSAVQYPGAYSDVIAVGALNRSGGRASYSAYGVPLDIVAPVGNSNETGVYTQSYSCFSTETCSVETNQNLFVTISSNSSPINVHGTSFAAPQVAGIAALIKSKDPSINYQQMYNLLTTYNIYQDWPFNHEIGHGSPNMGAILDYMDDLESSTNPNNNPSPNGDARSDIVAHNPGNHYVHISASTGSSFSGNANWNSDSRFDSSWTVLKPADVNGDGSSDVIGFHEASGEVDVLLSNNTSFGKGFRNNQVWNTASGYSGAWDLLRPGDVNGDGKADLIAFNSSTSYVNVTLSDGTTFGGGTGASNVWLANTGYNYASWTILDPADVNGDDRVDFIAMHKSTKKVYVSLSNGSSFATTSVWNSDTGYGTKDWVLLPPADVNADGRADLIAFNVLNTTIDVTLSNGSNFGGGYRGFQVWNSNSAYSTNSWTLLSPSDVTGDGRADIIAFNRSSTTIDVTPSTGSNFGGGYKGYQIWSSNSGYNIGNWRVVN